MVIAAAHKGGVSRRDLAEVFLMARSQVGRILKAIEARSEEVADKLDVEPAGNPRDWGDASPEHFLKPGRFLDHEEEGPHEFVPHRPHR